MTSSSSPRRGPLTLTLNLTAALLLSACASTYTQGTTPAKRINENRALFESWPLNIQNAVMDKKIEKGMTAEMVVMSLGKPSKVTRSYDKSGEEIWIYGHEATDSDVGATNMSLGTGPLIISGPVTSGSGGMPSDDYQEISFKDGKVTKAQ